MPSAKRIKNELSATKRPTVNQMRRSAAIQLEPEVNDAGKLVCAHCHTFGDKSRSKILRHQKGSRENSEYHIKMAVKGLYRTTNGIFECLMCDIQYPIYSAAKAHILKDHQTYCTVIYDQHNKIVDHKINHVGLTLMYARDLQGRKHLLKHFKRFDTVLRSRCKKLSDDNDANLKNIEWLTAEYKGITETIAALKGDVDTLKAVQASTTADVQLMKEDLAKVKADTTTANSDAAQAKDTSKYNSQQIQLLINGSKESGTAITTLQTNMNNHKTMIDNLQADVKEAKSNYDVVKDMVRTNGELHKKMQDVELTIEARKNHLHQQKQYQADNDTEIKLINNDLNNVWAAVNKLQSQTQVSLNAPDTGIENVASTSEITTVAPNTNAIAEEWETECDRQQSYELKWGLNQDNYLKVSHHLSRTNDPKADDQKYVTEQYIHHAIRCVREDVIYKCNTRSCNEHEAIISVLGVPTTNGHLSATKCTVRLMVIKVKKKIQIVAIVSSPEEPKDFIDYMNRTVLSCLDKRFARVNIW